MSSTNKRRKQIEGWAGALTLRKIKRAIEKASPERAEEIGAGLGRIIKRLSRKHRERANSNLKMAFPEWEEAKVQEVSNKVFEHFGMLATDFLAAPKRDVQFILDNTEIIGMEHLEAALTQKKGVLLVTGHFGNRERMAAYLGIKGVKLSVVARDADDEGVTGIMNGIRGHFGTQVISRGNAARPLLEKLRANELVGILPDQNSNEVFIDFFGKPAGTVLGPGVLHERTKAPVIAVFCMRVAPLKYRLTIYPELLGEQKEGYVKGEAIMREFHALLEQEIRKYPEQWLWFHDRWRNARRKGLL